MTTNTTTTPATETKLTVVTKAPPAREYGKFLKPRQKSDLTVLIEGIAVGQCLEYRGPITHDVLSGRIHPIRKRTGKIYSCLKVEGGSDIYCTGVKA